MKSTLLVLFILFGATTQAHPNVKTEKKKRDQLLQQMQEICMKKFPGKVVQRRKTCECLLRNFNQKLSASDLVVLLNDYKTAPGKKSQKATVNDSNEALYMFNMDVSEACLKNPTYKLSDPQ
ncbi:MAG: hypothetical protein K2Q26_03435 [Bdellovibrionales bacterium]|nr:hypothetical protein [Bdellovibrionales bacterium]